MENSFITNQINPIFYSLIGNCVILSIFINLSLETKYRTIYAFEYKYSKNLANKTILFLSSKGIVIASRSVVLNLSNPRDAYS